MAAEAWGGQCTRKGKEGGNSGRKFESFVVGKLRKSLGALGGWMAWAKGDWAVSLAGKEYTGGHLPSSPHHTYPIPRLPLLVVKLFCRYIGG